MSRKGVRLLSSAAVAAGKRFKVLFCGHEFSNGFRYSKEALLARYPQVDTVQCSRADLHKEIATANVVVPLMCRMDRKEIEIATNLKMIMQYGIGLEGVDIPVATAAGVWVCKIPSEGTGNAQSCAEHSIFLALSLLRNVHEMNRSLRNRNLGDPMGRTLYKSTAIIYGFGGIGKQLLQRLRGFDMSKIIVVSRNKVTENSDDGVEYITTQEFHRTASVSAADIVFICCSQNADNVGLVNSEFLGPLKQGVLIVNVARGGLFNYSDVHAALLSGKVGGLGLDVYHTEPFPMDDALLQHPGVVCTPHIAGVTEVSYRSMALKVAENVGRILAGERPVGNVNEVPAPKGACS